MAETMPANAAAAGRRMPNSTTVASHSSPLAAGVVELLTLVWNDAYMMPPDAGDGGRDGEEAQLHPQRRDTRGGRGHLRRTDGGDAPSPGASV